MFKKQKGLSLSIVVGFSIGIFCIAYAISLAGELSFFLDWTSVFITLGGTLGSVVVSFPFRMLKNLGSVIKKAFTREDFDLQGDINIIVSLSEVAKRQGLLALERVVDNYTDDQFIKKGILSLVDSKDKEQLKNSLELELYYMQQRHVEGISMIDMIASTAPSLGLLGTYVGLIPMLQHLEDPTKLGPLMAVELVTSFYGAFLAYVVFSPMAKRLKVLNRNEVLRKELVIEGLMAIRDGKSPMIIKDEFYSLVAQKQLKSKRFGLLNLKEEKIDHGNEQRN